MPVWYTPIVSFFHKIRPSNGAHPGELTSSKSAGVADNNRHSNNRRSTAVMNRFKQFQYPQMGHTTSQPRQGIPSCRRVLRLDQVKQFEAREPGEAWIYWRDLDGAQDEKFSSQGNWVTFHDVRSPGSINEGMTGKVFVPVLASASLPCNLAFASLLDADAKEPAPSDPSFPSPPSLRPAEVMKESEPRLESCQPAHLSLFLSDPARSTVGTFSLSRSDRCHTESSYFGDREDGGDDGFGYYGDLDKGEGEDEEDDVPHIAQVLNLSLSLSLSLISTRGHEEEEDWDEGGVDPPFREKRCCAMDWETRIRETVRGSWLKEIGGGGDGLGQVEGHTNLERGEQETTRTVSESAEASPDSQLTLAKRTTLVVDVIQSEFCGPEIAIGQGKEGETEESIASLTTSSGSELESLEVKRSSTTEQEEEEDIGCLYGPFPNDFISMRTLPVEEERGFSEEISSLHVVATISLGGTRGHNRAPTRSIVRFALSEAPSQEFDTKFILGDLEHTDSRVSDSIMTTDDDSTDDCPAAPALYSLHDRMAVDSVSLSRVLDVTEELEEVVNGMMTTVQKFTDGVHSDSVHAQDCDPESDASSSSTTIPMFSKPAKGSSVVKDETLLMPHDHVHGSRENLSAAAADTSISTSSSVSSIYSMNSAEDGSTFYRLHLDPEDDVPGFNPRERIRALMMGLDPGPRVSSGEFEAQLAASSDRRGGVVFPSDFDCSFYGDEWSDGGDDDGSTDSRLDGDSVVASVRARTRVLVATPEIKLTLTPVPWRRGGDEGDYGEDDSRLHIGWCASWKPETALKAGVNERVFDCELEAWETPRHRAVEAQHVDYDAPHIPVESSSEDDMSDESSDQHCTETTPEIILSPPTPPSAPDAETSFSDNPRSSIVLEPSLEISLRPATPTPPFEDDEDDDEEENCNSLLSFQQSSPLRAPPTYPSIWPESFPPTIPIGVTPEIVLRPPTPPSSRVARWLDSSYALAGQTFIMPPTPKKNFTRVVMPCRPKANKSWKWSPSGSDEEEEGTTRPVIVPFELVTIGNAGATSPSCAPSSTGPGTLRKPKLTFVEPELKLRLGRVWNGGKMAHAHGQSFIPTARTTETVKRAVKVTLESPSKIIKTMTSKVRYAIEMKQTPPHPSPLSKCVMQTPPRPILLSSKYGTGFNKNNNSSSSSSSSSSDTSPRVKPSRAGTSDIASSKPSVPPTKLSSPSPSRGARKRGTPKKGTPKKGSASSPKTPTRVVRYPLLLTNCGGDVNLNSIPTSVFSAQKGQGHGLPGGNRSLHGSSKLRHVCVSAMGTGAAGAGAACAGIAVRTT